MPKVGKTGRTEELETLRTIREETLVGYALRRCGLPFPKHRVSHSFHFLINLRAGGAWVVSKISSIIRHLVCIASKLERGQDCSWHWQHILREFGIGRYSHRASR